MALVIPIDECLSDSPTFRRLLSQSESNLEDLEARLDKTLKLSNGVGECGRAYVTQQTQFLASLWELSSYFGLEQGGGGSNAGSALAHINRMIQVMRFGGVSCVRLFVRDVNVIERSSPPTPFPIDPFYLLIIRDHAFGSTICTRSRWVTLALGFTLHTIPWFIRSHISVIGYVVSIALGKSYMGSMTFVFRRCMK